MLWQLLLRQHISLLADSVVADTSSAHDHTVAGGERVGVSEVTSLSQEASTAATDSGRSEQTSHQPGLERRSSRPDHMPAVEWWVPNLDWPLTPFLGQNIYATTFFSPFHLPHTLF